MFIYMVVCLEITHCMIPVWQLLVTAVLTARSEGQTIASDKFKRQILTTTLNDNLEQQPYKDSASNCKHQLETTMIRNNTQRQAGFPTGT